MRSQYDRIVSLDAQLSDVHMCQLQYMTFSSWLIWFGVFCDDYILNIVPNIIMNLDLIFRRFTI